MTTVLVTGSNGQVGRELLRAQWPDDVSVAGCDRTILDITDEKLVLETISDIAPTVIVNAAAYTEVDRAEEEAEAAFAVNATGVHHLTTAAAQAGCALIHISTDYVFDGTKDGWYRDSDPIAPLGVYGASKAAGEAAAAGHARHLILRTSWVYGALGTNFVATMLRVAETTPQIRVVDDQLGCPTSAADIATAIVRLVSRVGTDEELAGLYHLASPEATSWCGFAAAILAPQIGNGRVRLTPITTAEYPTPAPRPANSRLDSSAIERAAGIRLPDWSDSLPAVVEELAQNLARYPQ